MRTWINLFEANEPTCEIVSRAFHHGQQDLTLQLTRGQTMVGWMDFVLFDDEVSVQMNVDPQYRRQGIGRLLLQNLQHNYPDSEIDLGMLTDKGAALVRTMKTREEPNGNVAELMAEREMLKNKIASYYAKREELMKHEGHPSFERLRDQFVEEVSDWNDCYDRIADIEDEIGQRKPTKRIFE